MSLNGVAATGRLVPADLPTTDDVDRQIATLDARENELEGAYSDRKQAAAKRSLTVGGIVGVVAAVGAAALALRSGRVGTVGTIFSGLMAGAWAGGMAFGVHNIATGVSRTPEHLAELRQLRSDRTDLQRERSGIQATRAIGIDTFQAGTDRILAAYDHNGDGGISILPGQALGTDERLTPLPGRDMPGSEFDRVRSLGGVFSNADAAGNGDGHVDGRELGTYLISRPNLHMGVESAANEDRNDPLYWIHVQDTQGQGVAHEFRPESSAD